MDNLNLPLNLPLSLILIWDIKRSIEKNLSLRQGLQNFSQRLASQPHNKDSFKKSYLTWWNHAKDQFSFAEMGTTETTLHNLELTLHQRALIHLIEQGLRGQPIYEALKSIETDFIEFCEADIQEHAAKLPLILQIPLIFLVFPAICMLLLVPALLQFLH